MTWSGQSCKTPIIIIGLKRLFRERGKPSTWKMKVVAHTTNPKHFAKAMWAYHGLVYLNTMNCAFESYELFGLDTKRELNLSARSIWFCLILTKWSIASLASTQGQGMHTWKGLSSVMKMWCFTPPMSWNQSALNSSDINHVYCILPRNNVRCCMPTHNIHAMHN